MSALLVEGRDEMFTFLYYKLTHDTPYPMKRSYLILAVSLFGDLVMVAWIVSLVLVELG